VRSAPRHTAPFGQGAAPWCPLPGPKTTDGPHRAGRLPRGDMGLCVVWEEALPGSPSYLVQLVDQELRLQLDRVGSMLPLLVLEQAQLQLERLQEERLQEERLQDDRLQLDRL
jgi:hypothetical protein